MQQRTKVTRQSHLFSQLLSMVLFNFLFLSSHPIGYHGIRASASPVLTATWLVNGKLQMLTPYRIDTPQPIAKNCNRWLCRRPLYSCQFGAKSVHENLCANG